MLLPLISLIVLFSDQFVITGLAIGENLFQNITIAFPNSPLPFTLEDIQLIARLSGECSYHLQLLSRDVNQGKEWALKMVDASAKPQAGIFLGNIMHVGNYDECLEVRGPNNIKGKYCTALFDINEEYDEYLKEILEKFYLSAGKSKVEENHLATKVKKSYGFCVPKSCTEKDLALLFNYTEDKLKIPLHFHFELDYSYWQFCDDGETPPFSTAAIIAIVVFSTVAIIIICSTLYEVSGSKPDDETKYNLYTSFSLMRNARKLFSTATSPDSVDCLNGIRVISMMWIVLGHGLMYQLFFPQINATYATIWRTQMENLMFVGMTHAVDTFFTISGLLVVYLYLKNKAKGLPFSVPTFYIHRILRLTPSLAMVVLLLGTLVKYLCSGPYWSVMYEIFQRPCEEHWWSTLIYLQNYIHPYDQCAGHAWYLAVDTQMYFISPLILYPLVRWPKKTFGTIFVFVVLNCAYVFEITWKKHLGTVFFDLDEAESKYLYVPTHVRGTVYLMGMVCGYYVFHYKYNRPLKLCKRKVLGLWIFSLLMMLVIMYWNMNMTKNVENTILEASFFNSLTRVLWAVGLSIIIILCISGYGGLINTFLSHKIFTVLIRLNYNIYLLHLLIMIAVLAQSRSPGYFSNLFGMHKFWGDYMFTVGASVIWTLAFESPILALEKIVFGRRKKTENGTAGKVTNNGHQTEIPIDNHYQVEITNGNHQSGQSNNLNAAT